VGAGGRPAIRAFSVAAGDRVCGFNTNLTEKCRLRRLLISFARRVGGWLKDGFEKRFSIRSASTVITAGTPVVIVGWHLIFSMSGPPAKSIVAELYSVMRFVGTPAPNHVGTRMIFLQTTEKGFGVFWCAMPNGERRLLYEQIEERNEPGYTSTHLQAKILGWSPDDKVFAYVYKLNNPSWSVSGQWAIVIGDGNSGKVLATVPVRETVTDGAWLTSQKLVYYGNSRTFHIAIESGGKWKAAVFNDYFEKRTHKLNDKPPLQNLTAFDEHSVVWQQGGAIWGASDNDSEPPAKVWDAGSNALAAFSFSPAGRRFLLQCNETNGAGQFFARFSLASLRANPPPPIITKLNPGERPRFFTEMNGGSGVAYITYVGNKSDVMVMRPSGNAEEKRFQWGWGLGYAKDDHGLYVVTSRAGEPTGIWEHDFNASAPECVVPNGNRPFRDVKISPYISGVITNAATNHFGEILNCYTVFPTDFRTEKRYPLVLGVRGYGQWWGAGWNVEHQAFANCGAFFVSYDRRQFAEDQWADDVLAVYESLARMPNIDTNRVYLYGVSAGSGAVWELLQRHPKLWGGAIIFSPTYFPEPATLKESRMFADTGSLAFGSRDGFAIAKRFQDGAIKSGNRLRLQVHPGLGHILKDKKVEEERLREALMFMRER